MGMSASQARLLSLTGRLHDVEFKAQNIMSQKVALATQRDDLYQKYCEALDATKIQVAYIGHDAIPNYIDANYKTLCTYQENRKKQYTLKDNNSGLILVTENISENYKSYGNDKYAFAWAMMGFGESYAWSENGYKTTMGAEIGIGNSNERYDGNSVGGRTGNNCFMTQVEQIVFDRNKTEDPTLEEKYQAIIDASGNDSEQKNALTDFREYLYSIPKYNDEIFDLMNADKNKPMGSPDKVFPDKTWDAIKSEFNYYLNLWSAINEAGGCKTIDTQYASGEQGTEWFNNVVEAGLVTIQIFDGTGEENIWSETSVATSIEQNYLQETEDETDLKKAEAEYQHNLTLINNKDKKFDTDLSKLETERSAIKTEIDSLKSVRDENVERTFGIFS